MFTFRRTLVDEYLNRHKKAMTGHVLDIGGKRKNIRGTFFPPKHSNVRWECLNIDKATQPDYCCPASNIPLEDNSLDCLLLCEVLEHVDNPEEVLRECHRILKPSGQGFITMPFLYRIHADPYDYQRWTKTKLNNVLTSCGFDADIEALGGLWAVVFDLFFGHIENAASFGRLKKGFCIKVLKLVRPLFALLEGRNATSSEGITTGWAIRARKF